MDLCFVCAVIILIYAEIMDVCLICAEIIDFCIICADIIDGCLIAAEIKFFLIISFSFCKRSEGSHYRSLPSPTRRETRAVSSS